MFGPAHLHPTVVASPKLITSLTMSPGSKDKRIRRQPGLVSFFGMPVAFQRSPRHAFQTGSIPLFPSPARTLLSR